MSHVLKLRSILPAAALLCVMAITSACSDRDYDQNGHMRTQAGQSSSGNHRNNSYRDPNPQYQSNDDMKGRRNTKNCDADGCYYYQDGKRYYYDDSRYDDNGRAYPRTR